MNICGIIAEYDPFHNGHAWHLQEARRISGADCLICVISGSFTQRGMPALLPAHVRAAMALKAGADIVLQLPVSFSVSNAERYAAGGVWTLKQLGASSLCFGAEPEGIAYIARAAEALENPDSRFETQLKQALSAGISFPEAQGKALAESLNANESAFSLPNTALAIAYARANIRLNGGMALYPIRRLGSYHDPKLTDDGSFPSATAVRNAILAGKWEAVAKAVPKETYQMIGEAWERHGFHAPEALDDLLRWKLRENHDFERLPDLSEGIENRLSRAADCRCRQEMVYAVKTKRYPYARINRILTHVLLGTERDKLDALPQYAYILGFKRRFSPLLRLPKENAFQLFTAAGQAQSYDLLLDIRADDLWALGAGQPFGALYRNKPVIL